MTLSNTIVEKVLQSPAHRVLSGSTLLVRYTGVRSGNQYTLPVRYADAHHGLVVMVDKPETKTWWRNFVEMGQVQVMFKGRWTPMTAHALRGTADPEAVTPLLRSYALRFANVVKDLDGDTLDERVRESVVVWLRPSVDQSGPTT